MAVTVDLATESDADYVQGFRYCDSNNVDIDLTGSTLSLMVRANPTDTQVWVSVASPSDGIVLTGGGLFTLTLPIAALAKMPAGSYVHSLVRTRPDGIKELLWSGTLTHTIGPTR